MTINSQSNLNVVHGHDMISCHTLFDVHLLFAELDFKVVFALDFSKTVSEANLLKQFTFSQEISDYWKISPERSTTALVVYGESAETIPVDVNSMKMSVPQQSRSEHRRMDLALKEAASHFSGNTTQNKLIMLMTSGNQFSGADGHKDDQKLLSSIIEELYSRNINVLIVPVGLGADFKDHRLKRPQSLFPLTCFEDMRNDTAKKVANVIMTIISEFSLFYFFCIAFRLDFYAGFIHVLTKCLLRIVGVYTI